MEVKGVDEEMDLILDNIDINPKEEEKVTSIKVKRYIKLMGLAEKLYSELNDEEKEEAINFFKKIHSSEIPEYLSVREVAQLLEVTPQMVRRYCAEEKIKAFQRLEGSGSWLIESTQFLNHPGWPKFFKSKEKAKDNSVYVAEKMLDYLSEDEE